MKYITLCFISLFLFSCTEEKNTISGEVVFNTHCIACHGVAAAGIYPDWKKPLENGKYSPPPLNGSAHAWHHSPEVLLRVINNGGIQHGGQMPAFKDILTEDEKQAVISYFQNLWPNDIKEGYNKRFGTHIPLQ